MATAFRNIHTSIVGREFRGVLVWTCNRDCNRLFLASDFLTQRVVILLRNSVSRLPRSYLHIRGVPDLHGLLRLSCLSNFHRVPDFDMWNFELQQLLDFVPYRAAGSRPSVCLFTSPPVLIILSNLCSALNLSLSANRSDHRHTSVTLAANLQRLCHAPAGAVS